MGLSAPCRTVMSKGVGVALSALVGTPSDIDVFLVWPDAIEVAGKGARELFTAPVA